MPAKLVSLQLDLANSEASLSATYLDDSIYFKNVPGYIGSLKFAKTCNVAMFENAQLAFNARYGFGSYNFQINSGSYQQFGILLYSMRDIVNCAKTIGGSVKILDQNEESEAQQPWVARLSAIEDCWKNHLECLISKSLAYPWATVDPIPLRLAGIGKLVDAGYCVVTGFDPHDWQVPGFMACNASNGNNVLGSVGSTFVLTIVASTSDEFASEIIAGDGWVIAFESGFSDSDIREALQITGGKLISR